MNNAVELKFVNSRTTKKSIIFNNKRFIVISEENKKSSGAQKKERKYERRNYTASYIKEIIREIIYSLDKSKWIPLWLLTIEYESRKNGRERIHTAAVATATTTTTLLRALQERTSNEYAIKYAIHGSLIVIILLRSNHKAMALVTANN